MPHLFRTVLRATAAAALVTVAAGLATVGLAVWQWGRFAKELRVLERDDFRRDPVAEAWY